MWGGCEAGKTGVFINLKFGIYLIEINDGNFNLLAILVTICGHVKTGDSEMLDLIGFLFHLT